MSKTACACMGEMYGEPYCYCSMKSRGLEHIMVNNPLRKAEEERSTAQWKALIDSGWFDRVEEE